MSVYERNTSNLVEKIEFRGKPYLFYPTWKLDVAIIRAGEADDAGNLSFESEADIAALKAEVAAGRNPKEAKVALAKEITTRFHSALAADTAEQDFINRSKGGVPDEMTEISLSGAPLGIGAVLKATGLASSGGDATRLIDGGGVRVNSNVVADKALKLAAGSYVVQVGKRKFVKVTLG